jgi:hypothetical protein
VATAVARWLAVLLALCGGVGWLYLVRDSTLLDAGPRLHGALPLEELAHQGAQPLARVALAWLPAGFVAGLALELGARRARGWVTVLGPTLLGFVLLFASTAGSEAVSRNQRLTAHLEPALRRSSLWVAVAFIAIGALLALAATRVRRRGSSGPDAGAPAAP